MYKNQLIGKASALESIYNLYTIICKCSKDVTQGHIVVERDKIGEVKRVHSLRTDGEYVLRYGCGNLLENNIRVEDIYHNKKCAQGKAGQELMCLSLWYCFVYNIIRKQKMGEKKKEVMTEDYGKIPAENIMTWADLKGAGWSKGHDCRVLKNLSSSKPDKRWTHTDVKRYLWDWKWPIGKKIHDDVKTKSSNNLG